MSDNLVTKRYGFTLIELMIVIAVIAILVSIGAVSYRGVQKNSAESAIKGDLAQAALEMENTMARAGDFPTELPAEVKASDGVTLSIPVNEHSDVQYGVLFHKVCNDLVDEGWGKMTNGGGGTEDYITGCHVWDYNQLQIHGWDSKTLSVPLAEATVRNLYSSVTSDSSFPNKRQTALNFANELADRYTALGGTFPVTTFWDDWADDNNGGKKYEELPPSGNLLGREKPDFCVEAVHEDFPNMVWYIRSNGMPTEGNCY